MKDNTEKIDLLNKLTKVNYSRTANDVWNDLEEKLGNSNDREVKVKRMNLYRLSIAASIAIILGLGAFMRFYQAEYTSVNARELAIQLPDGSTVDLNFQSTIKYHPYWWKIDRSIQLEGEAYFEVEKGKTFRVKSRNGSTTVLGTSFNIYSRDNEYEVHCVTGRVKVEVVGGMEEIITPDQKAKLTKDGLKVSEAHASHAIDWKSNLFYFTREPLSRVFREIEIAYGTKILVEAGAKMLYSGNFVKTRNIEEALAIVCAPLNLTFVKQKNGDYLIKSN